MFKIKCLKILFIKMSITAVVCELFDGCNFGDQPTTSNSKFDLKRNICYIVIFPYLLIRIKDGSNLDLRVYRLWILKDKIFLILL